MQNSKKLKISELKAGMVSAFDIKLEGRILLTKGSAITKTILAKLSHQYIINRIDVLVEDNSQNPITVKINNITELEATFNEMSTNLEDIFKDLSKFKGSNIVRLRTFLQKIQEEFKATGTVLRDIILYGSGEKIIFRHSLNVAAISYILGKWLGFSIQELNTILLAAILHDFGKMDIDERILKKDTKNMTVKELEIYKAHPISAYHFIKEISYIGPAVGPAVLLHHERLDGSGFPLFLSGDKIPKLARVIAIADTFDRINSNRYTSKTKGIFEALRIIQEQSLTKLDTIFCNMFLNHIINYYFGENVILSDKRKAKIIKIDINNITKPLLLGDDGFIDLNKEPNLYVESLIN